MTCPECGANADIVDGTIGYHTRLDNLAVCSKVGDKVKTDKAEPKPARKPRTKK